MSTFNFTGPDSGLKIVYNEADDGSSNYVTIDHIATGFTSMGDSHDTHFENEKEAREKMALFLAEYYKLQRSVPGDNRLDLSDDAG